MQKVLKESELQFKFNLSNNEDAKKFDEQPRPPEMSGQMKVVDFLVDLDFEFWLIEVKDPSNTKIPIKHKKGRQQEFQDKIISGELASHELGPKAKESFLYLYLSDELQDKFTCYYVVLGFEDFDKELLEPLGDDLSKEIYLRDKDKLKNKYFDNVLVFTTKTWNDNFSHKCLVTRLT